METMQISDYKRIAKEKLKGNWGPAVKLNAFPATIQFMSTLIAIILTLGIIAVAIYFINNPSAVNSVANADSQIPNESYSASFGNQLSGVLVSIILSMISTGILWTSLDWYRNRQATVTFKDSMRGFMRQNVLANFMLLLIMFLFKLLWTLLFFIPGMIKTFSYSQTIFIYKDVTDNKKSEDIPGDWTWYITQSRRLMDGYKAKLFWLEFSFIGWYILVILTLGIAWFWVMPYVNMTRAVFYDKLAGDKFKNGITNY